MKDARDMTIQGATAAYEAWLGEQIPLIPEDLERKHELTRSGPVPFLRGRSSRRAGLRPPRPPSPGRFGIGSFTAPPTGSPSVGRWS
jgi:hypothetical protein